MKFHSIIEKHFLSTILIYMLRVSIMPLSMIFRYGLETVLTMWHFFGILFFFLLQYILHLYLGIFLITCNHIFCCSIVNASNIEYTVLQISFKGIRE